MSLGKQTKTSLVIEKQEKMNVKKVGQIRKYLKVKIPVLDTKKHRKRLWNKYLELKAQVVVVVDVVDVVVVVLTH